MARVAAVREHSGIKVTRPIKAALLALLIMFGALLLYAYRYVGPTP